MRPAIIITALIVVVVAAAGVFALVGGDGGDGTTTTTDGAPVAAGDGPSALGDATTTSTTTPPTTAPAGASTTRPAPTTSAAPSTRATAPPPTTTPGVQPNNPPVVTVGPPNPLQRFEAFFDAASGRFVASVPLTANVTDPEGDAFTVDWFSSLDGYLGSGQSITAGLSPDLDTSQPVITARVTDATGAVGEGSIQIIVWIRSDE